MATTYPQGYQPAGGGQPVVIQVVQQKRSSSDGFLKICGCLAGTGLAIFIGIVAGFLLLIGSLFLAFMGDDSTLMTPGIVLVVIGGILIIGSCYACMHFRKELENDNNASAALIVGQQQAGHVYTQPQPQAAAYGQPIISPAIPQPPPGVAYPGPYQVPMHPGQAMPPIQPGYNPGQAMPPVQPGYIPGQMVGPVPTAAAYPGEPAPPYTGQMHSSKAAEAATTSFPSAPITQQMQTSEYDRPPAYAP
ncbi:unnamed protein product [Meganyctiphanes norvegica]|uniref:Uncharacterized protein n=1 Tax=Meganyctiphanes norvegica TaxID=48144 RepID=A0AAV2S470_MEGNR